MTEFNDDSRATRFSWLRRWWRHLWADIKDFFYFVGHGVLPGVTPDPCPHLADPDFWNNLVLQPTAEEAEGLVVRIGRHGIGHVYINGQELQRVTSLHISVRPMEPVEVTLVMRAPIDLQAMTYHVDVCPEERPKEETNNATPDEIPNAGA